MKFKNSQQNWQKVKVTNYGIEQTPIGSMIYYPSNNMPRGYLLCDGSTLLIADYPLLFNAIGYVGGSDVPLGYFKLPDMRHRVPGGYDLTLPASDPLKGNFGSTVGSSTHTLTIDEMPSHSHTIKVKENASNFSDGYPTSGNTYDYAESNNPINPTGGNQPHSIVQPTMLYNWLIKAKHVTTLGGYSDDFEVQGNLSVSGNYNIQGDVNVSGSLKQNNKSIVDIIYPVGSVYISFNDTNPSNLFGGSWTKISDRFLLASGSTYSAGSTGGRSEVKLDYPNYRYHVWGTEADDPGRDIGRYWEPTGSYYGLVSNYTTNRNEAFSIMPPYLAVYMWKRTA